MKLMLVHYRVHAQRRPQQPSPPAHRRVHLLTTPDHATVTAVEVLLRNRAVGHVQITDLHVEEPQALATFSFTLDD